MHVHQVICLSKHLTSLAQSQSMCLPSISEKMDANSVTIFLARNKDSLCVFFAFYTNSTSTIHSQYIFTVPPNNCACLPCLTKTTKKRITSQKTFVRNKHPHFYVTIQSLNIGILYPAHAAMWSPQPLRLAQGGRFHKNGRRERER